MSPTCIPSGCDIAVVGGGIVGLATARELLARHPGASVVVLEAADRIGTGQTGHNSGVVHAGIYYEPGSLKAELCVAGAARMFEYCEERGIAAERCGKLIVALDESELPRLDELERRGHANGVPGLRRVDAAGLREIEPNAAGIAALHSPATGIADFAAVAEAFAADVRAAGGSIEFGAAALVSDGAQRVRGGSVDAPGETAYGRRITIETRRGRIDAGFAVFCAGVAADRLAEIAGAPADPRIVPFRGSYLRLKPAKRDLVRGLIYPVPDPRLPFLGVHLTRSTNGDVLVGPTALLQPRARSLAWPGTFRMAARHWRAGAIEMRMAASRGAFARAAARYVPGLTAADMEPAFAGYRAQALGRDGSLVDDFVVHQTPRAIHVRNAPSPAATSSLALAELIADRADAEISG